MKATKNIDLSNIRYFLRATETELPNACFWQGVESKICAEYCNIWFTLGISRIYRICVILFLVIFKIEMIKIGILLKMKITKNSIPQIPQIL